MCGRFLLTSPPDAVGQAFGIGVRDNFPPRYNVAPTQPIGIVRLDRGARAFALARWGFIPGWAKKDYHDRMGSKPLINARGDSVLEKPAFRHAFRRRRCLIPADGFYEWRTENGGRQPYLIAPAAGGVIAFGGIWETAHDADGGEIDTAAIITTESGPDVAALHDREPFVVAKENFARWLDPDERSAGEAAALIGPPPAGFWSLRKVSKALNNARNEGEDLLRETEQPLLL